METPTASPAAFRARNEPGPVRWGLVGTNGYARNRCAPAFTQVDNARLVTVASSEPAKAEVFAKELGVTATASLDELVASDDVEAVWIASPSYLHYEQGSAALAAGKHVLLEKPLALEAAQAWDLVTQAASQGVVLATGYQARYVAAHLRMKALIDEGAIGKPVMARTFYAIHRGGPPPTWRLRRTTARWGSLADIGTHHLDLLRMLMGEVADVSGFTAHRNGYETEDAATAILRFEAGTIGTLSSSTALARLSTIVEVHGTDGSLVATNTSPDGQGHASLQRGQGAPEDITGPTPLAVLPQLETVSRAIAGENIAFATGADGARNVEILEQIAR